MDWLIRHNKYCCLCISLQVLVSASDSVSKSPEAKDGAVSRSQAEALSSAGKE